MLSVLLAKKTAELFIFLSFGYILVKAKVLKPDDATVLNRFLIIFLVPLSIMNSYQQESSPEILKGFFAAVLLAALLSFYLIGLAGLLRRPMNLTRIEEASMAYTNCGGIVLCVLGSMLGDKAVIYALPYIVVDNTLMWSIGKVAINEGGRVSLKDFYTNPAIYAICIGLIGFVFNVRFPSVFKNVFSTSGTMLGPLGMMAVGLSMGSADLRSIFVNKRAWMVSLMKLIILPLPMVLLVKLIQPFSAFSDGLSITIAVLLAFTAPTASSVVIITQQAGKNARYASEINVLCTLLCIVTMPLMIFLYEF